MEGRFEERRVEAEARGEEPFPLRASPSPTALSSALGQLARPPHDIGGAEVEKEAHEAAGPTLGTSGATRWPCSRRDRTSVFSRVAAGAGIPPGEDLPWVNLEQGGFLSAAQHVLLDLRWSKRIGSCGRDLPRLPAQRGAARPVPLRQPGRCRKAPRRLVSLGPALSTCSVQETRKNRPSPPNRDSCRLSTWLGQRHARGHQQHHQDDTASRIRLSFRGSPDCHGSPGVRRNPNGAASATHFELRRAADGWTPTARAMSRR